MTQPLQSSCNGCFLQENFQNLVDILELKKYQFQSKMTKNRPLCVHNVYAKMGLDPPPYASVCIWPDPTPNPPLDAYVINGWPPTIKYGNPLRLLIAHLQCLYHRICISDECKHMASLTLRGSCRCVADVQCRHLETQFNNVYVIFTLGRNILVGPPDA